MFISGFLHSGTSLVSDFIQDISHYKLSNGGDECYFLREVGGAIDIIYDCDSSSVLPKQQSLKFSLYLIREYIYNRLNASEFYDRIKYQRKCKRFWSCLHKEIDFTKKLELINDFYNMQNYIHLNAVNLDMPFDFLELFIKGKTVLLPVRNVYAQLIDIEQQNYFYGPFDYHVEYMLGRYELQFLRRKLYLETLQLRLQAVKRLMLFENVIVVDVESLLLEEGYRESLANKLHFSTVGVKFNRLGLDRCRKWIAYDATYFNSWCKKSIYTPSMMEQIGQIQTLVNEIKCGS